MSGWLIALDLFLAHYLAPLPRIIFWAAACGALCMAIYALLSPQKKLRALQSSRRETRGALMRHDGDWDGLVALIRADLAVSLKAVALLALPFILSTAPLLWAYETLANVYTQESYLAFGPAWMQGFEFWFFLPLVLVSLAIKIIFRLC